MPAPLDSSGTPKRRLSWSSAFASLSHPNYRRFFLGQLVSRIGTFMQATAQAWLVLQLTDSAAALGVVVACQTIPILVIGPFGGMVADRTDRRRLLIWLQVGMAVLALVLGLLTVFGMARLWHVLVLAALLGGLNAFELPVRQAFVHDMVGGAQLRSAVSLSSVLNNVARAVGPSVAGLVIDTGGTAVCFLVNAGSYIAVIFSLAGMDTSLLTGSGPGPKVHSRVRDGLAYVRSTPDLALPLLMITILGTFAIEFPVTLPIMAREVFSGSAAVYGFITAAQGVGAVLGGLYVAARDSVGIRPLVTATAGFAVVMLLAALAPSVVILLIAMVGVGACNIIVVTRGNTILQLSAIPEMRGRVMSLFAVANMGTTAFGGPLIGALSEYWGGRAGLGIGAASCVLAALIGLGRARSAAPREN